MIRDTNCRQADAGEIVITPQMVDAGIQTLREFHFGEGEARIVEAVYLAMDIERQAAIASASETNSER